MEIFLIRHGTAAERSDGVPDEVRELTPKGQRQTQQVADRLRSLDVSFERILSSPLVRAQQTAEILQDLGSVETFSGLIPGGDLETWLEWLREQGLTSTARLALVGHQPDLGHWAEQLVWGAIADRLRLKKAGLLGLATPSSGALRGQCQLFLLTAPKWFL